MPESNLRESALELVGRCDEVYKLGGPKIRRVSNQFFFTKLLVSNYEIAGAVLKEPWASLLAEDLLEELAKEEEIDRDPVFVGPGSKMTKLAGPPGLEPGLTGPEPVVLPIALRPNEPNHGSRGLGTERAAIARERATPGVRGRTPFSARVPSR